MFDKLMEKKGKPLDPMYKDAKMSMLQELRNAMSGMMKDDLSDAKGMKKVEVAGNNPDALAAGLDKAKEMVGKEGDEESGESKDEEAGESDDAASLIQELIEHEASEGDLTSDKIDDIIKMLEQKKTEMSGSPSMTPALDKMTGQG